ncbi:MAG: OprO/OprP family phosphate-selective porin [Deltaproteobacteria bacterium]
MKRSAFIFLSTLALGAMPLVTAHAGPVMEFGDESYLQMDVKLQGIADYADFGSGLTGDDDKWDLNLRRTRISLTGFLNETWGAKFQTCGGTSVDRQMGGTGFSLANSNDKNNTRMRVIDAYLMGLFNDWLNIKVGLTKIPLTRANLDECFAPLTTERSRFVYTPFGLDASKSSRDMGIVASGNFFEDHIKYWAAIMEGRDGAAKFPNPFIDKTFYTSPEPDSNLEYVLRLHYSFLDPENGPTSMGYDGTYLGKKGRIFTIGAAGAYEADVAYENTAPAGAPGTPQFFEAKVLDDDKVDYWAFTADAFLEIPVTGNGDWLTLTGLYLKVDLDDAYKTARAVADLNTIVGGLVGQREGWLVKGGYILPFRVKDNGMIQPFARYEHWDYAHLYGVDDQTVDEWGVGFNYYPLGNLNLRFALEYQHADYDKPTKFGDYMSQKNNIFYDDADILTLEFMISI